MRQSERSTGRAGRKANKIYTLSATALMTAVICILAPLSFPVGAVPVSLATLAILFAVYLLGWKSGTLSCVLYILIGMIGIPVFSGFGAGVGRLLGPTGGYIAGYLPMALVAGILLEKVSHPLLQFLAIMLGTAVCYVLGTVWFCYVMKSDVAAALGMCVLPFLPGDIVKSILVLVVAPPLKKRLYRAGVLD